MQASALYLLTLRFHIYTRGEAAAQRKVASKKGREGSGSSCGNRGLKPDLTPAKKFAGSGRAEDKARWGTVYHFQLISPTQEGEFRGFSLCTCALASCAVFEM